MQTFNQIMDEQFLLQKVMEGRWKEVRESIKHNALDYSRDFLTVTLRSTL